MFARFACFHFRRRISLTSMGRLTFRFVMDATENRPGQSIASPVFIATVTTTSIFGGKTTDGTNSYFAHPESRPIVPLLRLLCPMFARFAGAHLHGIL